MNPNLSTSSDPLRGPAEDATPPVVPTVPVPPVLELPPTEPALATAFEARPATYAPPSIPVPAPAPAVERVASGLWNWVVPGLFLVTLALVILYVTPYLHYQWKILDAQADAEALFLKRRAELKAEAEHADQRLDVLDKRVHLTSLAFREVVRKAAPVVVNVANYREVRPAELKALEKKKSIVYDPENDKRYVQTGVGSGLLVKPGIILTNFHVVKGAQRLRISFASGQSVGVDPDAIIIDAITDLAVVRLPAPLPPQAREEADQSAAFADSDKDVQVGDWVLAVGSPLGLRQTVTHGVISAKGRLLGMLDLVELLQTDAAMNPGNSGGPLFDQRGRVVGINVAIVSDNGGNQGLGFAIPSNTAKKIVETLLTKGHVPRGYLGIAMEELPGPDAKALKLDDGAILVKDVVANEAAANAGIKVGDIILKVNKEPLSRLQPIRHFRQLVVDLDPGAEVTLEILRDEERRTLTVTVGKRPAHLP